MPTALQIYHFCQADGRQETFKCGYGTIFNEYLGTCDHTEAVYCRSGEGYAPVEHKPHHGYHHPEPHHDPYHPEPHHGGYHEPHHDPYHAPPPHSEYHEPEPYHPPAPKIVLLEKRPYEVKEIKALPVALHDTYTNFDCRKAPYPDRHYADPESGCQVFFATVQSLKVNWCRVV